MRDSREKRVRGNGGKGPGDKVCPSRTLSEHEVRHCLEPSKQASAGLSSSHRTKAVSLGLLLTASPSNTHYFSLWLGVKCPPTGLCIKRWWHFLGKFWKKGGEG